MKAGERPKLLAAEMFYYCSHMANLHFTRFELGPNDWLVRYKGGEPLARAYCFHAGGGPAKWQWATWTYPSSNGLAESLEDALACIKAAVGALPEAARFKQP